MSAKPGLIEWEEARVRMAERHRADVERELQAWRALVHELGGLVLAEERRRVRRGVPSPSPEDPAEWNVPEVEVEVQARPESWWFSHLGGQSAYAPREALGKRR